MKPSLPPIPSPEISKSAIQVVSSPKTSHKKLFLLALTIIFLLPTTAAGVYFLGYKQLLTPKAYDCNTYKFNITQDGNVTTVNNSSADQPAQKVSISINGSPTAILDVPPIAAGNSADVAQVSVPITKEFTWDAVGSTACANHGSFGPIDTPTPIPTQVPDSTPTPEPTSPVIAYVLPTSAVPTDIPAYIAPSPTPPSEIAATGTFENTLLITAASLVLIGLGAFLAF